MTVGAIAGIVLLIVVAVLLGIVYQTNSRTKEQEELHRAEMHYVRDCSSRLRTLQSRVTDCAVAGKLENAFDYLHASPAKSDECVMEYELEVIRLVGELEKNIMVWEAGKTAETLDRLMSAAEERNRILRCSQ